MNATLRVWNPTSRDRRTRKQRHFSHQGGSVEARIANILEGPIIGKDNCLVGHMVNGVFISS